jgi:hypothetical protein
MNVTLCTCHRNAEAHLERYFVQVANLHNALLTRGDTLRILIGEGDSTDRTRGLILSYFRVSGLGGALVDTTHGGPHYGSVETQRRFAQLAACYNTVWTHIAPNADAVLFVEGDLIWQAETLVALLDALDAYPVVAPLALHAPGCTRYGPADGRYFHDTWAYRRGGVRFTNELPFHPQVNGVPLLLDSAGSCLALRGEVARSVSFPADEMVVGMTRMAGGVWLLPHLEVYHPNE